MKLSTLLLAGSLVANAAIVVLIVRLPANPGLNPDSPGKIALDQAAAAAETSHHDGAQAKSTGVPNSSWEKIRTDDLHALVARLRAAGFPDVVIRAIVEAQVWEQFDLRRKAITGESKDFQFWKASGTPWGNAGDLKQRAALRALDQEQAAAIKDLLGPNPIVSTDLEEALRRRQYGNLPKEKTDQLKQIAKDYEELTAEVRTAANGVMIAEDREKLAYLNKERQADIAAALTPEEMEDYQLHSSPTASRLRYQLSGLDINEDQYRAVYKLQSAFDEKYKPNGVMPVASPNPSSPQALAQQDLVGQIKATLGEPLGTQYEHALNPAYQTVSQLVTRLNLPTEAVDQVLNTQKDIEQRAQVLRADQTLAPADRARQLAALGEEANQKVSTALGGTRGLEAYRQHGGAWLNRLRPPALPPTR